MGAASALLVLRERRSDPRQLLLSAAASLWELAAHGAQRKPCLVRWRAADTGGAAGEERSLLQSLSSRGAAGFVRAPSTQIDGSPLRSQPPGSSEIGRGSVRSPLRQHGGSPEFALEVAAEAVVSWNADIAEVHKLIQELFRRRYGGASKKNLLSAFLRRGGGRGGWKCPSQVLPLQWLAGDLFAITGILRVPSSLCGGETPFEASQCASLSAAGAAGERHTTDFELLPPPRRVGGGESGSSGARWGPPQGPPQGPLSARWVFELPAVEGPSVPLADDFVRLGAPRAASLSSAGSGLLLRSALAAYFMVKGAPPRAPAGAPSRAPLGAPLGAPPTTALDPHVSAALETLRRPSEAPEDSDGEGSFSDLNSPLGGPPQSPGGPPPPVGANASEDLPEQAGSCSTPKQEAALLLLETGRHGQTRQEEASYPHLGARKTNS
ncbi:hypothetical protein cyc_01792 [Cyclospora cayetanensis]|uniref:Uncharacterized protein n=1 Tax=Cyclospora cayetanensis TaxID=88456 RepID=A0A1D3D606_9EIME|nr:hypothetical protein cyc_01792 [Cyclospora cayetanensis]